MVSTASGDRLATVASKACVAERPSGSVAVIVTSAEPLEMAVIVTADPETDTLATPGLDDLAE